MNFKVTTFSDRLNEVFFEDVLFQDKTNTAKEVIIYWASLQYYKFFALR